MLRLFIQRVSLVATVWILMWAFMHIIQFALIVWPFSAFISCAILYLAGWAALYLLVAGVIDA